LEEETEEETLDPDEVEGRVLDEDKFVPVLFVVTFGFSAGSVT
jgi:hypothetical protein